jgi:hypothetical protein
MGEKLRTWFDRQEGVAAGEVVEHPGGEVAIELLVGEFTAVDRVGTAAAKLGATWEVREVELLADGLKWFWMRFKNTLDVRLFLAAAGY